MQGSFELPRDQSSRGGDIELGAQMNSGELGLENFFKKVLLDFLLLLLFFICQTKGMINIVTFCFSLLRFLIFCSTYNCLLSAVWALINLWFTNMKYIMSCHIHILFIWQVQDIDKEYEKLEKLLKKLQV